MSKQSSNGGGLSSYYTNARMPKMQGLEPNPYMPRKLKCCRPDQYLHADRLTPAEWGGWWERMAYNAPSSADAKRSAGMKG